MVLNMTTEQLVLADLALGPMTQADLEASTERTKASVVSALHLLRIAGMLETRYQRIPRGRPRAIYTLRATA